MQHAKYGLEKLIPGASLEDAKDRVTAALGGEGFGILTQIDIRAVMKKKLDVDHKPYLILGACNPKLAYRALSTDSQVGLLLPCNVVVREADGGALVSIIDPKAMFTIVDHPDMAPIVSEVDEKLRRVLAAL